MNCRETDIAEKKTDYVNRDWSKSCIGYCKYSCTRKTQNFTHKEYPEVVFVSFPGDEKSSGGCIAAGRGFFHINSHGGAEPCPFSPYSDINVRDTSLREAMKSKLFVALREGDYLLEDHAGGCVLYEKRDEVEALFANEKEAVS